MADKKELDPNPPAEDGTSRCPLKKGSLTERSLTGFEFESEPEFKKQKLEQLRRKAYCSVLLASNVAETSGTSHNKSRIIQMLMKEWNIDHETCIDNSVSSESLVEKRVHASSAYNDEDDSPANKKIKLHKQAYDHVLHAFLAESPSLSSSRTLIMQDLLNECSKTHMASSIDEKIDLPLVEPFTTSKIIVEPRSRLLPEGLHFRPTDLEMSNFLKQKALGEPVEEACIVPEERHDIFSIPPRDLPGYPEETHWYYYCMKPKGQDPQSLWTRFREDTAVFDPEGNCVGIKRRFTITERDEKCDDDIFLADEEEPPVEEWFIKEISLPSSVADTDLVLCHVVLKKRMKTTEENEEYYDEEEEEEEDEE